MSAISRPIQRFRPLDINRDFPSWELPPDQWTDGRNMLFRDGFAQRINGEESVFETVPEDPQYLINAVGENGNYWVYPADDGTIRVTDGNTHETITPSLTPAYSHPTQSNPFTGGTINGLPFLNWPANSAYWALDFATPTAMVELPDAPGCRAMRAYNNFLIAMDTGDAASPASEYQVRWSDEAADTVPSTWTPAATNLAGDFYLSATRGRIIDGAQLGPSFFIYKQGSSFRMTFVGAPKVMEFQLFSTTMGTLSRNCVAEFERNHVVLTDSDVIIHDGSSIRSLIDERNRRWLFTQLGSNYERSLVVTNPIEREIWICVPFGQEAYPERALVWNASNNRWGIRELNTAICMGLGIVEQSVVDTWTTITGTWDAQTRIWNIPTTTGVRPGLLKGNNDGLFAFDTEDDTVNAYLERTDLDLGDRNTVKTLRRVIPRVMADTGTVIAIRVGKRDTTDVAIEWQDEVNYTVGTDEAADVFVSGKLLSVRFRTAGSNVWKMSGFDFEVEQDRGNF